jgi:hypothetical protein
MAGLYALVEIYIALRIVPNQVERGSRPSLFLRCVLSWMFGSDWNQELMMRLICFGYSENRTVLFVLLFAQSIATRLVDHMSTVNTFYSTPFDHGDKEGGYQEKFFVLFLKSKCPQSCITP